MHGERTWSEGGRDRWRWKAKQRHNKLYQLCLGSGWAIEHFVHIPCGLDQGYENIFPLAQPGLWVQTTRLEAKHWPSHFSCQTRAAGTCECLQYCTDPYKRASHSLLGEPQSESARPALRQWTCSWAHGGQTCTVLAGLLHSCSPWGSTSHRAPLLAWEVYHQLSAGGAWSGWKRMEKTRRGRHRQTLRRPTSSGCHQHQIRRQRQEEVSSMTYQVQDVLSPRARRASRPRVVPSTHSWRPASRRDYLYCKNGQTRWKSVYLCYVLEQIRFISGHSVASKF